MNLVGPKSLLNGHLCSVAIVRLLRLEQHKVLQISCPSSVKF